MRPPGSAADRIGSSGNGEISRRISETDQCSPRGGFAPFTLISRGMSEFGENGAYVARVGCVCVCDPPGPWPIAFALQESARFRGESQKLTHVPARRACSIYTDFSGPVGIR